MTTPIDPLPEHELCAYEKLRENIIQEREKAMIECGFFAGLKNIKKDIGFVKTKENNRKGKQLTGKVVTHKAHLDKGTEHCTEGNGSKKIADEEKVNVEEKKNEEDAGNEEKKDDKEKTISEEKEDDPIKNGGN